MKLSPAQIALYIIFIICILLIGYYYSSINNTDGFQDETSPSSITTLQLTNDLTTAGIKDIPTQKKLIEYLTNLNLILDRYKTIDVPITGNNNGNICENWDMYANGKYKENGNNCIKINGKGNPKCLDNNILTSCSNYYKDGEIDKLSTINIKDILDSAKYNMVVEMANINGDLTQKNNDIDNILNELISKRNLENQQVYFIDYNNNNLDDKKNIFEKYNKEFEKTENDVNINTIQFKQFLESNQSMNAKKDKYYNYIIWLIVLLIIVGILNFFFTEIL
jgi:hypothetical protein